jgi:protein-S-isoprenylcysteine O-methyltransferase Ste14
MSICIVSGLNHRYGWQPSIPFGAQFAVLGIAVAGALIAMWAMVTNKFFYSIMRIENEKGHTVWANGPYQYIRHPG